MLHLSEDPGSSALLRQQLASADLDFDVQRVGDAESLEVALRDTTVQLILADLPLPWPGALDQVQAIQRLHPDRPVVFRWGEPGFESSEHPDLQLATTIRQTLRLSPMRAQTREERQLMIAELVLHQQLVLELTRLATGDTATALAEITKRASLQLGVERVSIWDYDTARTRLRCLDMYVRSKREHQSGSIVAGHPRYRRALEQSLQIAATDAWTDPRTSEFLDGYLRPLGIRSMLDAPIRLDGQVVGVLCFEHVGQTRVWTLLEQCLATSLASLVARVLAERNRRQAAEVADRNERLAAIGRVAGTAAHDFNNQLTALFALIEELAAIAGPPGAPTMELIRTEMGKASGKVRQLLAIGRAANPRPVADGAIDLGAAITDAVPVLTALLGPRIELQLGLPDTRLRVRATAADVEQILRNLVGNAADAIAGSGGGAGVVGITLAAARSSSIEGEAARLTIRDTGPGLPAAVRQRLFEPFVTTKGEDHGSGLGLSSVHELVRGQGGAILCETSSSGTCFTIDLPLAE